jgi:hypothetical protein
MSDPDFSDALDRIRAARVALENAQTALSRSRRTAKGLEAAEAALVAAQGEMKAAGADFARFSDPRTSLAQCSSSYPIALLPVRIETRFVTEQDGQDALYVRVYPDDCWIDTFEPDLSASELDNAKRYWRSMWRAGGVEADRRAAWRMLVTAHGAGRAGFITDTYRPVNIADQPSKKSATDIILVIPTQNALLESDAHAITSYWNAAWLAAGDAAEVNAALVELKNAVGEDRSAQLLRDYVPFNFSDSPAGPKATARVSVEFVVFAPDPPASAQSWTRAAQLQHFPDCFVVLGFVGGVQTLFHLGDPVTLPLSVSPDPEADVGDSIRADPQTGNLLLPEAFEWTVDFPAAVQAGMGMRIPLDSEQARGFDRLLVFGLQLSADAGDGAGALAGLLQHHRDGATGLAVLAQGTPTHNTTGSSSGYGRLEDPDASFDDRQETPLFTLGQDPLQKRDGQWLSEALGVDPAVFQKVHGADGLDQAQARAMQRALWPATLGYWMDKLLSPVFSDDTVAGARWYAANFVSGRGAVPPIRIGGQPYGILPTTAFSQIAWLGMRDDALAGLTSVQQTFLTKLYGLLRRIDPDWMAMSQGASYVGKAGDAHQVLLDIVGLHPDSAEFYSRCAQTLSQLFNTLNLFGLGGPFAELVQEQIQQLGGAALLARLGYAGGQQPDLFSQLFDSEASPITTVVDDQPTSETQGVRSYTDDGRNYLHWLLQAAGTSLDALRAENGFSGDRAPQALLYLYLRQALMLGYFDSSYQLHKSAGFLSAAELAAMKPEPAFIHVDPAAPRSESRFAALYKREARITGSNSLLVSDYIATRPARPEVADFADQLSSISVLADVPTAALERLFTEHIDTCSYRFDSWLLGLANVRLATMRGMTAKGGSPTGLYLGAYAWVENLRPSTHALTPVKLNADLAGAFPGQAPLLQDAGNGGYIHAPSIAHARTAAVLRSGYLANAGPQNPKTMSVNLSSDRVRLALSILEGIRNGQSLGALLGYRFERGLHDDHGLAEVDRFIYPLRLAFPLVAGAMTSTPIPPNTPIEAVEARNVLDGRQLAEHIKSSNQLSYPFGLATLPAANAAESAALSSEANRLLDAYDSVADLALAEGVHQAVQGNFDRAGATLDAFSTSGNLPPDPEVVQTPVPSVGLTHRVAVHFRAGLPSPNNATPRSMAEPALDDWLASVFPDLAHVGCTVIWTDPVTKGAVSQVVHLADLGLRPIDLAAILRPDTSAAMKELDDRVWSFVLQLSKPPRPDATLKIQYTSAPAGELSVFAFSALTRSVQALLTRSRPLKLSDTVLSASATQGTDAGATVDRGRISGPFGLLQTVVDDLNTFVTGLASITPASITDPIAPAVLNPLLARVDVLVDSAAALLERAARFGLPQAGWGSQLGWKRDAFADLISALEGLIERWDAKWAQYNEKLAEYNALPAGTADADRFSALRAAELAVSSVLAALPPTPAALLVIVAGKAADFKDVHDQLSAIVDTQDGSFGNLLSALKGLLPLKRFEAKPFDVAPFEKRILVMVKDLLRVMQGVQKEVVSRLTAAQAQLVLHDNAAATADQTSALQTAAKALFGSDFVLYPEFGLDLVQAGEWTQAYAASIGGSLFKYLTQTAGVDFPVDEWLAGVARVRPTMRVWESVVNLTTSLGKLEPVLQPVQFPVEADAPWLALQFPSSYGLTSERLLYTAQYPNGFDATRRVCGLRLDEWTEAMPVREQGAAATYCHTGITFNYDRPNSEPPQSILLVTPASVSPQWQWTDLVGALNETLDLAKKRSLEPAHIDQTPYASFLPATVMAASLYGISISTSLGAANGAFARMGANR